MIIQLELRTLCSRKELLFSTPCSRGRRRQRPLVVADEQRMRCDFRFVAPVSMSCWASLNWYRLGGVSMLQPWCL